RRQLGNPPGDVRDDSLHDLEHESQATLRRCEAKLIEQRFAPGTERYPGLVVQGDADAAVRAGSQSVSLEDDLSDLRRNRLALPDDEGRAGYDLDSAGWRRLLRRYGRLSAKQQRDNRD